MRALTTAAVVVLLLTLLASPDGDASGSACGGGYGCHGPRWSPDGRRLVFAANTASASTSTSPRRTAPDSVQVTHDGRSDDPGAGLELIGRARPRGRRFGPGEPWGSALFLRAFRWHLPWPDAAVPMTPAAASRSASRPTPPSTESSRSMASGAVSEVLGKRLAHPCAGGRRRGHERFLRIRRAPPRSGDTNVCYDRANLGGSDPRRGREASPIWWRISNVCSRKPRSGAIRPRRNFGGRLHRRGLRLRPPRADCGDGVHRGARPLPRPTASDRGGNEVEPPLQHRAARLSPSREGRMGSPQTGR